MSGSGFNPGLSYFNAHLREMERSCVVNVNFKLASVRYNASANFRLTLIPAVRVKPFASEKV